MTFVFTREQGELQTVATSRGFATFTRSPFESVNLFSPSALLNSKLAPRHTCKYVAVWGGVAGDLFRGELSADSS